MDKDNTKLKKSRKVIQLPILWEKYEFPKYKIGEEIESKRPEYIKLAKNDYKKLIKKYGIYVFGWYFTEPNKITYFDKKTNTWKYAYIQISKIDRTIKKLKELV